LRCRTLAPGRPRHHSVPGLVNLGAPRSIRTHRTVCAWIGMPIGLRLDWIGWRTYPIVACHSMDRYPSRFRRQARYGQLRHVLNEAQQTTTKYWAPRRSIRSLNPDMGKLGRTCDRRPAIMGWAYCVPSVAHSIDQGDAEQLSDSVISQGNSVSRFGA
jgi:hypothetical protein